MDQFFFGDPEAMMKVCGLFEEIEKYLVDFSIPHCGEGFLSKAIEGIPLKRFPTFYKLQRADRAEVMTLEKNTKSEE